MWSPFGRKRSAHGGRRWSSRSRLAAAGVVTASVLVMIVSASQAEVAITTTGTPPDSPTIEPSGYNAPANDGLGVKPGAIKHVWLIVLENKAYDASFTGLNDDSYLSQTLPSQGALLTNYYGTGHSSLDNYLSLFSGQAPVTDDQDDCPAYDALAGSVDLSGSLATNPNYGQFVSAAGEDAPAGDNGCVYPSSVPTLFNQLDAAHVSWKEYVQDLGNTDASGSAHDAGTQYCGAPDATVGTSPYPGPGGTSSQFPNPSSANATDQYVAKHNPLPWFESILGSGDCSQGLQANGNSDDLAALLGPNDALYSDLQNPSSTPDLSVIIPNNCSNGHDAVCAGNNLSGGFGSGSNDQIPNTTPLNYTGGVYAENLFLEHIVPEIEQSPAFKHNGLIEIVWDEAYPPFTYSNSNANSTRTSPTAAGALATTDSAGETLFGRSVSWEPAGPNTPIVVGENGQQLSAGPGFNENLDRPSGPTGVSGTDLVPCTGSGVVADGQCYLGGGGTTPGSSPQTASFVGGSSTISDNSIQINVEGRSVSGTDIPAGSYVGQVTDTPATATAASGATPPGVADTGSFELVNANGVAVDTTGTGTISETITLGAETAADDPQYDAYDPTLGGGDTGALLISPFIKPGTVSNTDYNHYSTLRSLEDIFQVAWASPGLDNEGHIGYADQPGLAPFGPDVFTNASWFGGGPFPWFGHVHRSKKQ
jgi:Phosphoesterase family